MNINRLDRKELLHIVAYNVLQARTKLLTSLLKRIRRDCGVSQFTYLELQYINTLISEVTTNITMAENITLHGEDTNDLDK